MKHLRASIICATLALIALCCMGCTIKPLSCTRTEWLSPAPSILVLFDDYSEAEVSAAMSRAIGDFTADTGVEPRAVTYQPIVWNRPDYDDMWRQIRAMDRDEDWIIGVRKMSTGDWLSLMFAMYMPGVTDIRTHRISCLSTLNNWVIRHEMYRLSGCDGLL